MVCDTIYFMNQALQDSSKKIIVEGANATMLDIDFGKSTIFTLYSKCCQYLSVLCPSLVGVLTECLLRKLTVPKLGGCPNRMSTTKTYRNESGDDCDELVPDWLNPVQISSTEVRWFPATVVH